MTTNDAAERLFETSLHRDNWIHAPADDVRAALVAQYWIGEEVGRRATVERIRAAVDGAMFERFSIDDWREFYAILDAEAQR